MWEEKGKDLNTIWPVNTRPKEKDFEGFKSKYWTKLTHFSLMISDLRPLVQLKDKEWLYGNCVHTEGHPPPFPCIQLSVDLIEEQFLTSENFQIGVERTSQPSCEKCICFVV